MKRNTSIRLKAAFLLTVFALNTLVGFACSVGVDMGFNSNHHLDEETGPVLHIHKDGKRHLHHGKDSNIDSRELREVKAVTVLEREGKLDITSEKDDDNAKNKSHHNNEAVVHVHKNGKRHIHHGKDKTQDNGKTQHGHAPAEAVIHIHKDGKQYVHAEKEDSNSADNSWDDRKEKISGSQGSNENCCTDEVRNFEQLDKSIPNTVKIVHPIFLTAIISSYYDIHLLPHLDVVKDIKQFVRSYHPPIPDIRIAIQSFQI